MADSAARVASRPTQRERAAAEARTKILAAAADCIVRDGLAQVRMASIARAQSLDGARQAESQAQAQQQLKNFLNYGAGYQPGVAQMFH